MSSSFTDSMAKVNRKIILTRLTSSMIDEVEDDAPLTADELVHLIIPG